MGSAGYSSWGSSLMEGGIYLQWAEVMKTHEIPCNFRFFNRVVGAQSPFSVMPETDVARVAKRLGEAKTSIALYPVINHHSFTRNKYNLGLVLHEAGLQGRLHS